MLWPVLSLHVNSQRAHFVYVLLFYDMFCESSIQSLKEQMSLKVSFHISIFSVSLVVNFIISKLNDIYKFRFLCYRTREYSWVR
jgi:uncharacterized PurR-regulated membrane protein YhhQ (DUF165 family)